MAIVTTLKTAQMGLDGLGLEINSRGACGGCSDDNGGEDGKMISDLSAGDASCGVGGSRGVGERSLEGALVEVGESKWLAAFVSALDHKSQSSNSDDGAEWAWMQRNATAALARLWPSMRGHPATRAPDQDLNLKKYGGERSRMERDYLANAGNF